MCCRATRFQATCACHGFSTKPKWFLDPAEVASIVPPIPLEASLQPRLVEQGWEHVFELQTARECPSSAGSTGEMGRSRGEGLFHFCAKLLCEASGGL